MRAPKARGLGQLAPAFPNPVSKNTRLAPKKFCNFSAMNEGAFGAILKFPNLCTYFLQAAHTNILLAQCLHCSRAVEERANFHPAMGSFAFPSIPDPLPSPLLFLPHHSVFLPSPFPHLHLGCPLLSPLSIAGKSKPKKCSPPPPPHPWYWRSEVTTLNPQTPTEAPVLMSLLRRWTDHNVQHLSVGVCTCMCVCVWCVCMFVCVRITRCVRILGVSG